MNTTICFEGYWDLVLQKAVDLGIARSKTDAIRIGVMELGRLVENAESEMVIQKVGQVEAANRAKGLKPLSEEEVLRQYPELRE